MVGPEGFINIITALSPITADNSATPRHTGASPSLSTTPSQPRQSRANSAARSSAGLSNPEDPDGAIRIRRGRRSSLASSSPRTKTWAPNSSKRTSQAYQLTTH